MSTACNAKIYLLNRQNSLLVTDSQLYDIFKFSESYLFLFEDKGLFSFQMEILFRILFVNFIKRENKKV